MPKLRPRPEDVFKRSVVAKIQYELDLQDINREKLLKLLSISNSTLVRKMKDPGRFTLTELMMIARVTHTSVAELVTAEGAVKK